MDKLFLVRWKTSDNPHALSDRDTRKWHLSRERDSSKTLCGLTVPIHLFPTTLEFELANTRSLCNRCLHASVKGGQP